MDDNCSVDLDNKTAISVVALLVPNDSPYWAERSAAWYAFFYLMIVIYSVLFLGFGICCLILLAKRHLAQRFRVRTFIAIDLALIVLGFSRFVFLVLDPWGQSGFCTHYACIIISRLLGALAFPSLTASYTLVFLTLWISARIQMGRSCVQKLKILIPLCCIHYVVALIIETILLIRVIDSFVVLVMLVACEAIFSLWGFLVCLLFFVGGFRLLKTLERTARNSSVICKDTPNMSRHDLIERSKFKNQSKSPKEIRQRSLTTMKLKHMLQTKQKAALRKITLITYVTVILGMLYSLLSIVNLFIVSFSLFHGCPGDFLGLRMLQEVWLVIRYVFFTIEICMAVLLTYAITDYTPLIKALRKVICKVGNVEIGNTVSPSFASISTVDKLATLDRTTTSETSSIQNSPALSTRNTNLDISASQASSLSEENEQEMTASSSTPKSASPLVVSFSASQDYINS